MNKGNQYDKKRLAYLQNKYKGAKCCKTPEFVEMILKYLFEDPKKNSADNADTQETQGKLAKEAEGKSFLEPTLPHPEQYMIINHNRKFMAHDPIKRYMKFYQKV